MASERANLFSEGALYELIARGNKDVYFMKKNPADGGAQLLNPFETRYNRRPATLSEIRRNVPLNAADFGRACEFELESVGEIVTDATILIDLPTWLPTGAATASQTSGYLVQTPAGRQYGYTRGIAYFMFSKIQIYQDKILLQEFSGDALWGSKLARGTLNQAYMDQALTAMQDVSGTTLYRNATPGRLRLPLPMVGGAQGLPTAAIKSQTFRIRLVLRNLEDCIECSDVTVARPTPWLEPEYQVVAPDSTVTYHTPIERELIAKPTIQLETRHIYLDPESRAILETEAHDTPYMVMYENPLTFGGDDYKTANVAAAVFPFYTRVLDAKRPASRIFWFMRTFDDLMRNRRWSTSGYNNHYWQRLALIIASRDRESLWPATIWSTLTPFAKEDRAPGFAIGEMIWDLGNGIGQMPAGTTPQGSVNFSTADRPTLSVSIQPPNADQIFDTGQMDFLAVVESWSIYSVEEGRAFIKFN